MTMRREEDAEQIALCEWLDRKRLLYYHPANGGARSAVTGALLKRMGVKKGVPDICICEPNFDHHGLYIEMKKRKGGRVSEEQKEWLQGLTDRGYKAVVCRGWDEAREAVEEYMGWYVGDR